MSRPRKTTKPPADAPDRIKDPAAVDGEFATLDEVASEDLTHQIDSALDKAKSLAIDIDRLVDGGHDLSLPSDDSMLNGDFVTPAEAEQTGLPASESASRTGASTNPSAALEQIDEYLANQADSAVSGEFETVHEVMAIEQAAEWNDDEAAEPGTEGGMEAPGGELINDDEDAAEIACDDELAEIAVPLRPHDTAVLHDDPNEELEAVSPKNEEQCEDHENEVGGKDAPLNSIPSSAAAIAAALAGKPKPIVNVPTVGAAEIIALEHAESRSHPSLLGICRAQLFRICMLTSYPLRSASGPTRRMIGYAALLTLTHGVLLMLGKLVLSMMG